LSARKLLTAIFLSSALLAPTDSLSQTNIVDRFGADAIAIAEGATAVEAYDLDRQHQKNQKSTADLKRNRAKWAVRHGVHSMGIALSPEQISTATKLLVDGDAYWDPPKDDTLMCLFIPSHALRVESDMGVVVVIFEGNCDRIRLISEGGEHLGMGMLEEVQSDIWKALFEEVLESQ